MSRFLLSALFLLAIVSFLGAQGPIERMDNYLFEIDGLAEKGQVEQQVELMIKAEKYLANSDFKSDFNSKYIYQLASTEIDLSLLLAKVDSSDLVLGKAYEFTGTRLFVANSFVQSKDAYLKASEILSTYGLAYSAYRWVAIISGMLQDYEHCIEYYEAAIIASEKYFEKGSKKGNTFLFSLHTNVVSSYCTIYNFRKARSHANKAIGYAKASNDPSYLVSAKVALAQLELFVNSPAKALEILTSIESEINDSHPIVMYFYHFMGTALAEQGRYGRALINFEKALSLCDDGTIHLPNRLLNQGKVGEMKLELHEYSSAKEQFDLNIEFYEQQGGKFNAALSEAYNHRALAYLGLGNVPQARQDIKKALNLKTEFETSKIAHYSNLTAIYTRLYESTRNEKFIDSIYYSISKNDSIISNVREEHRYYEDALGLNDYIHDAYASNLKQIGAIQQIDPAKIRYDLVFKYFEGLKAYSLREILKTDDAVLIGNIDPEVLDEEKKIKFRLSNIQREKYEAKKLLSDQVSDSLDQVLEKEKNDYYKFLEQLEEKYPNYFRFQYKDVDYDLRALQDELGASEAIIEYFLDEESIYSLIIDRNKIQFKAGQKPNDWYEQLGVFRRTTSNVSNVMNPSIQTELFNDFTYSANYLYEVLLTEVLDELEPSIVDIKIIPDNELNVIPFDILLRPSDTLVRDFKNLNYLIKNYNLSYEQTASDLVKRTPQAKAGSYNTYVGFAPSYKEEDVKSVQGGRMPDLPMARSSIIKCADLLNGKAFDNDISKSQFIVDGMNADILHLAMHGIVDQRNPSFSYLAFSNSDEDKLYANQIYNLQLNTQLAILSACNTGTGKIINGDGVQNLARAFRFAGAQSTIMSLWSVPDEQTAKINIKFIENLKDGQQIDEALKNSKLSYLASAPKLGSHPFFWAGFIPSGKTNTEILFSSEDTSYLLYLGCGVLVLISLLLLSNFFSRNKSQYPTQLSQ